MALAITGAVLLGYSWTRKILQIAKLNDETGNIFCVYILYSLKKVQYRSLSLNFLIYLFSDFTELTDILSVVTGICMLAVGVLGIIASWLEDKTLHFIVRNSYIQ